MIQLNFRSADEVIKILNIFFIIYFFLFTRDIMHPNDAAVLRIRMFLRAGSGFLVFLDGWIPKRILFLSWKSDPDHPGQPHQDPQPWPLWPLWPILIWWYVNYIEKRKSGTGLFFEGRVRFFVESLIRFFKVWSDFFQGRIRFLFKVGSDFLKSRNRVNSTWIRYPVGMQSPGGLITNYYK